MPEIDGKLLKRRVYLRPCQVCQATQYFGEGLSTWKCPKCKGVFKDHLPLPTDPPHLILYAKLSTFRSKPILKSP